jgi:hypothetical protein
MSHQTIPIVITAIGVALLAYMIPVEGEPGLIPLLLIVVGVGWYFVARARSRSH